MIADLTKSKENNKAVKIAKDRHAAKILRHASLTFLKIITVVRVLTVQKELHLVLHGL